MKTPMVMTEPITLIMTADGILYHDNAKRNFTANMITIGMAGMVVISTASLTMGFTEAELIANYTRPDAGCKSDVFQEYQEQDVPTDFDGGGCKHNSGGEQGDPPGCASQHRQGVDDELRNVGAAQDDL